MLHPVLVVDDNEVNRYAVGRTLRRAGLDVIEASTGEDALAQVRQARPGLVVLDVNLPDISGLEVCRRLKSDPNTALIPVVHLSATMTETDSIINGLEAGAEGYLTHPIDPGVLVGTVRSLLRLRQAEEALRESEERFRATFEQAAVGIAHVGFDGRWLRVNRRLCEIVGYSPEELCSLTFQDITHSDDVQADLGLRRQMLRGEAPGASLEKRYLHKGGTTVWVNITLSVARGPDGEPHYFIVVAEDISARKDIERHLREQQAQVGRLNERLQRAMAETHHRVKNNLQVIAAMVDMQVMKDHVTVPMEELQRMGQHVRSLAAVHDLLTHEARETGQVEYVDVREMFERLRPTLETMMGCRPLNCSVERARLPVRQGTGVAVLVNELLSNAVKHGAGEVGVSLRRSGSNYVLEVTDNGPGFPEGFNAQQAAHTGLDLVESIGRWDLQGTVSYSTRPEGGGSVTVSFPGPDAPPGPRRARSARKPSGPRAIGRVKE